MSSLPYFRFRPFAIVWRWLFAACFLPLVLASSIVAEAQTIPPLAGTSPQFLFGNRPYHLVSTPVQRVVAILRDSYQVTNLEAAQWLIYAPDAPDTDDQSAAFSTLSIADGINHATTWSRLDPDARKLLAVRLLDGYSGSMRDGTTPPGADYSKSGLTTDVTYTALLYRRELVSGAPSHAPEPLPQTLRLLDTMPSQTIDFNAPPFQQWLAADNLYRAPGERDLDFALRVFRHIRATYAYKYDLNQDRRASSICRCQAADCGGLSQLFVAALRASGIPAVALCGRMARSADPSRSSSPGNVHVKSQFYAAGIGWVPVEMSGAVYDRASPESAYFGRSVGNFLTLSVGNDQQLSLGDGTIVNQRGMQGIRFWVWGTPTGQPSGSSRDGNGVGILSTSSWTVRQLPLFTQGRQIAEANH